MPRYGSRGRTPVLRTAPVLAVLVCHDGEAWLPDALAALRASTPRPRHVLAVDNGSLDATARLLSEAARGEDRVLDGVLTRERHTGFATAVQDAVSAAIERWGDPGGWIWMLHDDCAPDPDCLATLLTAADASPSAGVLGPLALDWNDPRLVVEAGLSTDASGHRQTGIGPSELDWSRLGRGHQYGQSTEVLAVPSAGMLVRRELWERLGGFDPAIPLLREDIDFGWRANRAGAVVLCVPAARMRHVRAVPAGLRGAEAGGAGPRGSVPALDRAHGLRTFLLNCALFSFLVGIPRLTVLSLVRALGFAMQRRLDECRGELRALGYVLGGGAGLLEGRALRRATVEVRSVRGLFTSRLTRLRNAVRAGIAHLVRRRLQADAALGRLPDPADGEAVWLPAEAASEPVRLPVGPQALPAGVGGRPRRPAGLRLPATSVAVSITLPEAVRPPAGLRPSPTRRPSPVPRDGTPPVRPDLVLVRVNRARLARQVLLAPPVLLVAALLALGLAINAGRLGVDLAGGRLLPVPDLAATWSAYLATWHPVAGGTAAPAPAALAVLGALGGVFAPFGGGPPVAVAVLMLGSLPLAGLAAYVSTRRMPVHRWVRALVAAAYALLPPATAAVAQGRLDVVVVHVLLPPVTAGIVALLGRARTDSSRWLSVAAASAFGLAVLGAFAPLVHLVLVGYALAGFVVVPGRRGDMRRRVAALFVVVLMPLALLLPWPAVLIQHPGVVLHGVGAFSAAEPVTVAELVGLWPGGPGAVPWVGVLVVAAALVGLVVRPGRAALTGLGLVLLGALAVALVLRFPAPPLTGGPAVTGWTGAGLVVVGWGLLLTLLGTCRAGGRRRAADEGTGEEGEGSTVGSAPGSGAGGSAGSAAGSGAGGPAGSGAAAGSEAGGPAGSGAGGSAGSAAGSGAGGLAGSGAAAGSGAGGSAGSGAGVGSVAGSGAGGSAGSGAGSPAGAGGAEGAGLGGGAAGSGAGSPAGSGIGAESRAATGSAAGSGTGLPGGAGAGSIAGSDTGEATDSGAGSGAGSSAGAGGAEGAGLGGGAIGSGAGSLAGAGGAEAAGLGGGAAGSGAGSSAGAGGAEGAGLGGGAAGSGAGSLAGAGGSGAGSPAGAGGSGAGSPAGAGGAEGAGLGGGATGSGAGAPAGSGSGVAAGSGAGSPTGAGTGSASRTAIGASVGARAGWAARVTVPVGPPGSAAETGQTPGHPPKAGHRTKPTLLTTVTAALGVLAMALAAFLDRDGPLDDSGGLALATTLQRELADTGRGVLVLPRHPAEPPRLTAGRMPAFGDDDLPPVNAATHVAGLADRLTAPAAIPAAIADAAASGVLFVVAPDERVRDLIAGAAGDLVAGAPPTTDGRPVLRVQLAAGQVTLISPEQARRAITASPPPAELGAPGIVPVDATPPAVAVRVSDGPSGRLLVIAAEDEPGWRATVDGRPVPVVRAWGHLVAVPLGTRAADVRVEQPTALRSVLLLTQAAMVLFVVLTAIPSRRPR